MTFSLWVLPPLQFVTTTCKHVFNCVQNLACPNKLEGPSTYLSILGMELDSVRLQVRLPIDKKECIITLLESWSGKRFCKRRELESIIGHLRRACKIVVGAYLWGPQWTSRQVVFLCNNELVVAILSSGTSRDSQLMVLMHFCWWCTIHFPSRPCLFTVERTLLPMLFHVFSFKDSDAWPLKHTLL